MAAKKKAAAKQPHKNETALLKARLVSSKELTGTHRTKISKLSAGEVKALVSAKKKLGGGSLHGRKGADFL